MRENRVKNEKTDHANSFGIVGTWTNNMSNCQKTMCTPGGSTIFLSQNHVQEEIKQPNDSGAFPK